MLVRRVITGIFDYNHEILMVKRKFSFFFNLTILCKVAASKLLPGGVGLI